VLDSISAQTYTTLEVIVVDNRSALSDEIAEVVHSYDGVRLIRSTDDVGYTGSMNRGMAAATGEYVYLTVDDVLLERECIEHLVKHAEAEPADGLLTGILLQEDRRTICCAGGEFDLAPVYHRKSIGAGDEDAGQFARPFDVSCVETMIFARLGYLRALGGFREEFYMYSDSIELSARVRKAGGRLVVVPGARAYVHDPPHSFTQEEISFHRMKNLYAMYVLHARKSVLPEFFLRYGLIIPLRAMRANRRMAWPLFKAWAWFLFKAPLLVRERVSGARATGPSAAHILADASE
jgi:GT2 family glycosyltransferase